MASGSKSLSSMLAGGHDYVYDYVCSFCSTNSLEKEATSYCVDCQEYLCAECFRHHRTPKQSRDHQLLDEKRMPSRPACDVCSVDQQSREAAGYCLTCEDYLCSECFKYHSRPKPMRHHELVDHSHMPLKKPSRDDNQKKPSIDDNQKKPSRDDDQKKPSRDDNQKKPSRDDNQKKLSRDDDQKKPSRDDDKKKQSRDDTQKKQSRDDNQKKPSRDDDKKKPSRAHNQKKPSRDDNQKKPNTDDNQKKPSRDDDQKKPSRDDSKKKPNTDDNQKKPSRDDDQKKPSRDDDQKKPSRDDNQKKPSRDDNQALPPSPAAAAPSRQTPSTRQHMTPSLPARDARATRTGAQQQQQLGEARRSRAVQDHDLKIAGQHTYTPWITGGVAVPANRLVLVDYNNCTITMLAAAGSYAQTQLALTSKPWDITLVRSSQLAVTCPVAEAITFVKLGDRIQQDHEVKVKGRCQGIACINDTLVVSCDSPVKVKILSLSGKLLQTVVTEDQGKCLFTYPWYIEVSRDHASLYISDWTRNTITRLSLAGQVLATFQDDELVKCPRGLAVDKAGSVYVCGDNVVQLASDLTQPRQLLQRSDGVRDPYAVCYCQATDKLYVGMWNSDVVKGFQLK